MRSSTCNFVPFMEGRATMRLASKAKGSAVHSSHAAVANSRVKYVGLIEARRRQGGKLRTL